MLRMLHHVCSPRTVAWPASWGASPVIPARMIPVSASFLSTAVSPQFYENCEVGERGKGFRFDERMNSAYAMKFDQADFGDEGGWATIVAPSGKGRLGWGQMAGQVFSRDLSHKQRRGVERG